MSTATRCSSCSPSNWAKPGEPEAACEQAALWVRAAWDALTIAPKEHWHVIFQDLRYALRAMAARPGFTAVAILSLALGIGANTAIFSLWNGVLHSSLPGGSQPRATGDAHQSRRCGDVDRPMGRPHGRPRTWLTYAEFEQLRDRAGELLGDDGLRKAASIPGRSASKAAIGKKRADAWSRADSFEVLGVSPAIGRVFTTADDRAETPYAVISYSYWQRRFGGRPDVLGKTSPCAKPC